METVTYKHIKYFNIAIKHGISLQKKAAKYKDIIKLSKIKCKWWQQRQIKKNLIILTECCEHNDIIITMCAFTLESFINYYAIIYKLDQLTGYNEKDSTKSKWKKYTFQAKGITLDDVFLTRIQNIMNDRNIIGHFKAEKNNAVYSEHSMADALKNLNEVNQIFQDLKVHDLSIDIPNYRCDIPIYAKSISMQYNALVW